MRKPVASALAGLFLLATPLAAQAKAPETLQPCGFRPACNNPGPLGVRAPWRHAATRMTAQMRLAPNHRARDIFIKHGGFGIVVAKFAYGANDRVLEDEEVDAFIQNGCGAKWYSGGSYRTTKSDAKIPSLPPGTGTIEGGGGRVYFDLSRLRLSVGKHRIKFVVKGDGSFAEAYVEVLPKEAQLVVTNIDGTHTTSAWAVAGQLVGIPSPAQTHGPDVLRTAALRGYYILYLTARPEWLLKITRDWLRTQKYPPGLVRITSTLSGASGAKATAYKTAELKALKAGTGITPYLAIGNKAGDVEAYKAAELTMSRTHYMDLTANLEGGHSFDGFDQLVPVVARLPMACRKD